MDTCHSTSGIIRRRGWLLLALFFVLTATGARATPAAAAAPSGADRAARCGPPVCRAAPARARLASIFAPIRSLLNNRTRMIQLATIGMCIGLFIMLRK